MKKLFPFTAQLENDLVILRLLQDSDLEDLAEVAFDEGVWAYFNEKVGSKTELRHWIQGAIFDFMNKVRIPFAIYSKFHQKVVGTTSVFSILRKDERVEVGYSWLGSQYRGEGINEAAKSLLIDFLFQEIEIARVTFCCDVENIASNKALLKIGATKEGVMRSFKLQGSQRKDVALYSIIKEDRGTTK